MENLTLNQVYRESTGCNSQPYLQVQAFDGVYPAPSLIAVTAGACDETAETAWILHQANGALLIREAIKIYDNHLLPQEAK